jgi:hypothetical protein
MFAVTCVLAGACALVGCSADQQFAACGLIGSCSPEVAAYPARAAEQAHRDAERQDAERVLEAQRAEAVQQAEAGQQKRGAAQTYKPQLSEKVEADNGAVYAVDLNSARHFSGGALAGIYDQGRGGIAPMWFDCAGHMREFDIHAPLTYAPPRSVGARLSAIACAEADRHPER